MMSADRAIARDGVYLLRGVLMCALVLTLGHGEGGLQVAVLATLPLMGGLAFGVALGEAERAGRGVPVSWALHLFAMWLATFTPAMWGNREVVRTCAVAGGVALLLRNARRPGRIGMAVSGVVLLLAAAATSSSFGLRQMSSEVLYYLGGAWPRGWVDLVRDTTLFLLGCWASRGRGMLALAEWRGLSDAARSLGRMPLTVLAVQYALAGEAPADLVLVAQVFFAVWWLRTHDRGPCEHVGYAIQMAARRFGARLRMAVVGG